MERNEKFGKIPDMRTIEKTANALKANGFDVFITGNGAQAKEKALELIPKNAEIMTMTSVTLDTIGLSRELDESGNYDSVRKKLAKMNRNTQKAEIRKLGAAPFWAAGSVHAITEEGQALVASATGSQLPAYAYGAEKLLWIVGAQKIVKNAEEGRQRIREYTFPLEDERALKTYGSHSGINKMMLFNKEAVPNRITIILVNEKLGF